MAHGGGPPPLHPHPTAVKSEDHLRGKEAGSPGHAAGGAVVSHLLKLLSWTPVTWNTPGCPSQQSAQVVGGWRTCTDVSPGTRTAGRATGGCSASLVVRGRRWEPRGVGTLVRLSASFSFFQPVVLRTRNVQAWCIQDCMFAVLVCGWSESWIK